MNRAPQAPLPRLVQWCLAVFAMCLMTARAVEVTALPSEDGTRVVITIASNPESYYVVLKGDEIRSIDSVVGAQLGRRSAITFRDPTPLDSEGHRFLRVLEIPRSAPLDLDQDGIDDVYELEHAPWLDPLNAADALEDSDRDGMTSLEEYRNRTNPDIPDQPTPAPPQFNWPPYATTDAFVELRGLASPGGWVRVEGGPSVVTNAVSVDGTFDVLVPLAPNRMNRMFAAWVDASGRTSSLRPFEVLQDSDPPTNHIDFPAEGTVLTTRSIMVAGRVGDMLSGFRGLGVWVHSSPAEGLPPNATTVFEANSPYRADVNVGIGPNGTYFRSKVPLSDGTNTITTIAIDGVGNRSIRRVTVPQKDPTGDRIEAVSGDEQVTNVLRRLLEPLVVRVVQADGSPSTDRAVTFEVTRSDGRLLPVDANKVIIDWTRSPSADSNGAMRIQLKTDAQGEARVWWCLGSDAGSGNNRARVTSEGISEAAYFCASARGNPAKQINIGSGNSQRAEAGAFASEALKAWVSDGLNPGVHVPVTFRVREGEGRLYATSDSGDIVGEPAPVLVVPTRPTGHAEVRLELGPDAGQNIIEADFPGNQGLPARFVVQGLKRDLNNPGNFSGTVLDNSNQPLGGAYCELTVANAKLVAVTDVDGHFQFSGVPGGAGHLLVNGGTANSLGGAPIPALSYPLLTYPVLTVPNADNALPSPVFLPRLNKNNEQLYRGTNDLVLTVEGMEGLKVTIKAGSMVHTNGMLVSPSNPARVSLNQVHHDLVPMPMPDGASPAFAWTLQPAGAHFNPPATVEYPNMSGLAPGSIAYFLSFNHDTERFEIVSSGKVTDDGSLIRTDPGGGLTLAGWGCNCPPYSVSGGASNCRDEGEDASQCHLEVGFDSNRNGQVEFGVDKTSFEEPYEFWVDSDHDIDDPKEGGELRTVPGDAGISVLSSRRGLEDLTRVKIGFCSRTHELLQCGHRLELQITGASVRVFKAVDGVDSTAYLSNEDRADRQLKGTYRVGQTEHAYRDAINPRRLCYYLNGADYARGEATFLIAAASAGSAEFRLALTRDGETVSESQPQFVEFHDLDRMYLDVEANEYRFGQRYVGFPDSLTTASTGTATIKNSPVSRVEDPANTIVFVHGWNLDEWTKKSFVATLYKRLWWAGFKGRFVAFRWPCLVGAPFQMESPDGYFTFNPSEFIAFKYANCLLGARSWTPASRVHVIAHSQGNVVASEALRQGLNVDTYIMMQAAVPAAAYDRTAETADILDRFENFGPTFDGTIGATPPDSAYQDWFSAIGSRARIFNFYNVWDYALSAYVANLNFGKPDHFFDSADFKYSYERAGASGQRHELQRMDRQDPGRWFTYRTVVDPHEVMAFGARARTRPAGAHPGNLAPFTGTENLSDPRLGGFGDARYEHSGQFNYPIQKVYTLFRRILEDCQIESSAPPASPSQTPSLRRHDLNGNELATPLIDDSWVFSANGQHVAADPFGRVEILNINAPDQFGASGPGTDPDFVGDDAVRVVGRSTNQKRQLYAWSEPFQVQQGKVLPQSLTITEIPPRLAERLTITAPRRVITQTNQTIPLKVTATYPDGSSNDVTPRVAWTIYRSSNPNVGTVTTNGVVSGHRDGNFFVTAVNEGVTAVLSLSVSLDDTLATLRGVVVDSLGQPVPGVSVTVIEAGVESVVTGADGRFILQFVPTKLGLLTVTARQTVGRQLFQASIRLQPTPGDQELAPLELRAWETDPNDRLAAGANHGMAIREDGALWGWGDGRSGQIGTGVFSERERFQAVQPTRLWRTVYAAGDRTLALDDNGALYGWGWNNGGSLGDAPGAILGLPTPLQNTHRWRKIAVGSGQVLGIREDGTLWAWGFRIPTGGRNLANTNRAQLLHPEWIWKTVAAGENRGLAVRADGTLWGWGDNSGGQLGDGTFIYRSTLSRLASNMVWRSVAAGSAHTIGLRSDGTLWSWGRNSYGVLGTGSKTDQPTPQPIGDGSTWRSVVCGAYHSVAIRDDGSLWAWGRNHNGQLGDGTYEDRPGPTPIDITHTWRAIAAGSDFTLAVRDDGSMWSWGGNRFGQLASDASPFVYQPTQLPSTARWRQISSGEDHTVGIRSDGTLWAWGWNAYGQVGDQSGEDRDMPHLVSANATWKAVATGNSHSLALREDGSLWGWGWNEYGQVGAGRVSSQQAFTRIGSNEVWKAISASYAHSAAIREDGVLFGWGQNAGGQIGNGTHVDSTTPQRVDSEVRWREVSCGGSYTLAIAEDGSLWGWGNNSRGQLGTGANEDALRPVPILPGERWTSVSAGVISMALHEDGTLWTWMQDTAFLGDGAPQGRNFPERILPALRWQFIGHGRVATAIQDDGTLWAWGMNLAGNVGNGTSVNQELPVAILPGSKWRQVAPGGSHTVALQEDDRAWSWGFNLYGQLGLGPFHQIGIGSRWAAPDPSNP